MDIKQESDAVFEEVKCEIKEHFLPIETIKKELTFNERNNQLNVIKNELFSIKQENCDKEYTERLQQIFIKDGSDCNQDMDDADMKSNLVKHNFKKRQKKGLLATRKYMKYWVLHKGILICKFCGNMFNRKFEFFCHAVQHFVQKRRSRYNQQQTTIIKNVRTLVKNVWNKEKNCLPDDLTLPTYTSAVCMKSLRTVLAQNLSTPVCRKPFKCNVCSKSFVNKYHLIKHMQIHTDEKPFKCEVCFQSFATKQSLLLHTQMAI